jgi:hypothetical protein
VNAVPTLPEFERALDSLVIVWPRGEEPSIGPVDDSVSDAVAAWVESVLTANPALVTYLHGRLSEVSEVLPGLRVLPVATLRSALLTTLRRGAYVGMGVPA